MTVIEPALLARVRARLVEQQADPTPTAVAAAMRDERGLVGDTALLAVVAALRRESLGAGPLDPLLELPGVTDIVVNGPGQVYVDTGEGLQRSDVTFTDDNAVRRLAQRLAASAGRRLDDAAPWVDVRLRDGTRFHAIVAPLARPGTCLSLRVPARTVMTLDDWVRAGSVDRAGADLLLELVGSRAAFVVSGGTGCGKTTLLSALLSLVDPADRIVIVEEATELCPRHPHVVSLEARQPNVEGAGEVTMRDLVRQALRMRPDRLVVGEVRGAEVVDLLAALNTGHEGGGGTVHANTAADVPARFEALGVAAGISRTAVHAQLAAALQVVVHLRRSRAGVRHLHELAVLDRDERGFVRVETAVTFEPGGRSMVGPGGRALEVVLARHGGQ
ncbi:MAG: TadA family conjugal transfer-associated ATPase [Nocardioidaceae bacterium]